MFQSSTNWREVPEFDGKGRFWAIVEAKEVRSHHVFSNERAECNFKQFGSITCVFTFSRSGLFMIYILSIFLSVTFAAAGADPQNIDKVDSLILTDLLENTNEIVNTKHSNSAGCKNSCTVKNYFSLHVNAATKEIEEIKKTPRSKYIEVFGTSVEESTVAKPNIKAHCGDQMTSFSEDVLKEGKVKLPSAKKINICVVQFGLRFGDRTWSEQLYYLKNRDTGAVIPGSFHALGTP